MLRQRIHSVLEVTQANRANTRESWLLALMTAGQAAASALILMCSGRLIGRHEVLWAVITAVLVLQPGFRQSVAASVTRMIANLLGAAVGLAFGLLMKDMMAAVVLALIVVILLCELWRLDLGVRPACASAIIVMMAGDGPLLGSSEHRVIAVVIGCAVAIFVQLLTLPLARHIQQINPP